MGLGLTVGITHGRSKPVVQAGGNNEPAGYAAIVYRPFNSKAASGGDEGTGSYPNKTGGSEGYTDFEFTQAKLTIQDDTSGAGITETPQKVMQFEYTAGTVSPGNTYSPGSTGTFGFDTAQHGNLNYRKLFVRAYFKLPTNFQNHTDGMKMWFFRSNEPCGSFDCRSEPIFALTGQPGAIRCAIAPQGTQESGTFYANENTGGQVNNLPVNTWHKVEFQLELNSAFGVTDGILRIWLNGVRVFNYTNFRYMNQDWSTYKWASVKIDPTWGGQEGTINETFFWRLDDFYISGKT